MKITFLTCFYFIVFSYYSYSQKIETKNIKHQLKDFSIFKDAILSNSAGLYYYNTIEEFNSRLDSLENEFKTPKNEFETYALYAKCVASIRCGHSVIFSKKIISKYNNSNVRLPFQIYYINNKLFTFTDFKDSSVHIPKFTEIVLFNNEKPKDISSKLSKYISTDGFNQTHKNERLKRQFFYYNYCFNNQPNIYNLKYLNENKDTLSITLKPSIPKKTANSSKKSIPPLPKKNIAFTFDSVNNISTLTLPYPLPQSLKYKKQLKNYFLELSKKSITNLVVDLRNNGGGYSQDYIAGFLCDSSYTYESVTYKGTKRPNRYYKKPLNSQRITVFIHKISSRNINKRTKAEYTKPQKNCFHGKIFVLTNGFTFSAASNLTSNLKQYSGAIVVGEETGGSYRKCSSGSLLLELPYSKINITINPIKFVNSVFVSDHKGGVLPKFEVKPSDRLGEKEDPQLQFIFDLIQKTKAAPIK